jgi:hypothetical protein
MLTLLLLACAGSDKHESEEPLVAPTLSWNEPADGGLVGTTGVNCSVVVNDFTLTDPAMHNVGQPEGYLEISVDDAVVEQTSSTVFTLDLAAGPHTLKAALFYVDGDDVSAAAGLLCEEGGEGCAPVAASIEVTAK